MKKSLFDLGKALSRVELVQINGKGDLYWCAGGNSHATNRWCPVPCFNGNCLL